MSKLIVIAGTSESKLRFIRSVKFQAATRESDCSETRASPRCSHVDAWLIDAGTLRFACWYS